MNLTLDQLSVGMEIQIGGKRASSEAYNRIVGKKGIITHLGPHPNYQHFPAIRIKNRVYIYVEDSIGGYVDYSHPTLMHLASPPPSTFMSDQRPRLYSWYIDVKDVILLDNESYLGALPLW